MSGADAIGDMVDGALAARATEPDHGEAAQGRSGPRECLNCGTPLVGAHCHACGQAGHVHKTIGAFFHDLMHGVFHFEGKIWRTVPALIVHPGRLTRDYIAGRRAAHVSPIALFLFCVFLLFAVVNLFTIDVTRSTDVDVNGRHIVGLEANKAEVARLESERAKLIAQGKPVYGIDGEIEGRKSGIAVMEGLNDPANRALGKAAAEAQRDTPAVDSDIPALNAMIEQLRTNPQLAIYKLQSNAYKFAWALIPISAPFVWLLFPFSRRFGMYDHTVFVTYSLCFMLILIALLTVLRSFGLPVLTMGLTLVPPAHIYRQVRGTYTTTRWGAVWRSLALCSYAFIALSAFLILLLGLG